MRRCFLGYCCLAVAMVPRSVSAQTVTHGGSVDKNRSPTSGSYVRSSAYGGYAGVNRTTARVSSDFQPRTSCRTSAATKASSGRMPGNLASLSTSKPSLPPTITEKPDEDSWAVGMQLTHEITDVVANDTSLCQVDMGSRDGIAVGDKLKICSYLNPTNVLGELKVIRVVEDRCVCVGGPCKVGMGVRPARPPAFQRVENVEGSGKDIDEAMKDAYFKAVHRAAKNTMVNSQTQVENDVLVKKSILTFSEGFVSGVKELRPPWQEGGRVHVLIQADVKRDDTLMAIGGGKATSMDVSGLSAESITKRERNKNARALLQRTLELIPVSLLDLRLIDKPQFIRDDENSTTLAVTMSVCVAPEKYVAIEERLITLLGCLSKNAGTVTTTAAPLRRELQSMRNELFTKKFLGCVDNASRPLAQLTADFGSIHRTQVVGQAGEPDDAFAEDRPPGTLIIIRHSAGDWRWFELGERIELPYRDVKLVVSFRDNRGGEVTATNVLLGPWLPALGTHPVEEAKFPLRTMIFSPQFLFFVGDGYRIPELNFADQLTVNGEVTLTNQELARVKTAVVNILPNPSGLDAP